MERSADEVPKQEPIASHPRVKALSDRAMKMYVALLHYASPDGSVVHNRVEELCLTVDVHAFYELLASGLLGAEWYVWNPVILDDSERLSSGEVP